jgi:two-component system, LytTR family, sensor kinase
LRDELICIEQYVEIQRVRFGQRLNYETHIEPKTLNCLVPIMLLQPLIENAIEHGVATNSKPSVVTVSSRLTNQSLIMTVESPKVTRGQAREGFGIGLSATKARLRLMYGDNQTLSVTENQTDRVFVSIIIISKDFLAPIDKQFEVPAPSEGGIRYG